MWPVRRGQAEGMHCLLGGAEKLCENAMDVCVPPKRYLLAEHWSRMLRQTRWECLSGRRNVWWGEKNEGRKFGELGRKPVKEWRRGTIQAYEGNTFEGTKVIRNASGLGRIGEDPAGGRCVRRGKAGAERGERRGRGGGRWRSRSRDEREAARRRERKEN